MLVSAAACATDNRALNKTSSATVSFFIDHVYANFSCTKITSPTRINVTRYAKTRHNDAFLEFQIFVSVSFLYLKLFSVAISMLYC